MPADPLITCPNCKSEIKLTESLAAPLIDSTKRQYEQLLAQKDLEAQRREHLLHAREAALVKEKESLDLTLAEKLATERTRIAAEESQKARLALASDLQQKQKELAELQLILKQNNDKLAEAQKAQADLLRKQRELDDQKRELDLTIEKRVAASIEETRALARKEAEDSLLLKLKEREQVIASMQSQIEDLKKRAEQGSQQLQGEVLELQLETLLAHKFPHDRIEPVPKGEHGGDILHNILLPTGAHCGTILWESKRTKNWSDPWLAKLREDQRAAKADLAVIVSATLPKGVETFDHLDGIWVIHPRVILPMALCLRKSLIEIHCARTAVEGQDTKMAMIYQYLTGPRFRQHVQAMMETFSIMFEDLAKEKKVITKHWAKREDQIARVINSAATMVGELQAIAGKSLPEIDALDLRLLESAEPA